MVLVTFLTTHSDSTLSSTWTESGEEGAFLTGLVTRVHVGGNRASVITAIANFNSNLRFDLNIAFRSMPTPLGHKGLVRGLQSAHTCGSSVLEAAGQLMNSVCHMPSLDLSA